MKKGIIWIVLTCLIVTSLVLASCTTKTTTSTTTTTTTTMTTTTKTTASAATTTAATNTTPTTTTTAGNWWDSLGTPQYCGTMTLRMNNNPATFLLDLALATPALMNIYFDYLFSDIWTEDPSVFPYNIDFRPPDYVTGSIAQTYEFTDPHTLVVHIRQIFISRT